MLFERRPTPPRQIDLEGDQYREVTPRSEPGQPVFKAGGVRWLLVVVMLIVGMVVMRDLIAPIDRWLDGLIRPGVRTMTR